MEFGPRAFGNHSILGDLRSPTVQKGFNLLIKFRESFGPLAPAVYRESSNSAHKLLLAPVFRVATLRHDRRRTAIAQHRQAHCHALRRSQR